jgi:hypothetical protein
MWATDRETNKAYSTGSPALLKMVDQFPKPLVGERIEVQFGVKDFEDPVSTAPLAVDGSIPDGMFGV